MSNAVWSARSGGAGTARLLILLTTTLPRLMAVAAAPTAFLAGTHDHHAEPGSDGEVHAPLERNGTDEGMVEYMGKLLFSAFLVIIGGVFSGLTLGLMGLDMVNLQVMSSSGNEREQKDSTKVLKLLEKGRHWVLVSLLLSNVIVNESLRESNLPMG